MYLRTLKLRTREVRSENASDDSELLLIKAPNVGGWIVTMYQVTDPQGAAHSMVKD